MEILRNIDNSQKTLKFICAILIIVAFAFSAFIYFYSMNQISLSREKVYLLNNGNALELVKSRNLQDNLKAEVKNHVTMFHEFFYNLDPDAKDIKSRVNRALNLIDESGKLLESQRNENLYYQKMIEGSISSRFYLDSIVTKSYDEKYYTCKVFGKQKLERSSKLIVKNLISECKVRQLSRTDNNPHGLIIENFIVTNNKTIDEQSK